MRPVYDVVRDALGKLQGGEKYMVILDDITSLEWIGCSPADLVRFSRALRSLCFKVPGQMPDCHYIDCLADNIFPVQCIPHHSTSRSHCKRAG
jgi:hypothetical protein